MFMFSTELQQYAERAIKRLIDHFGAAKESHSSTVQPFICSSDAQRVTTPMMAAPRGYDELKFHTACETVIREVGEIYPDWAKQGKIACTLPVSGVAAELGLSLQNETKTAPGSRLAEEKVDENCRL